MAGWCWGSPTLCGRLLQATCVIVTALTLSASFLPPTLTVSVKLAAKTPLVAMLGIEL